MNSKFLEQCRKKIKIRFDLLKGKAILRQDNVDHDLSGIFRPLTESERGNRAIERESVMAVVAAEGLSVTPQMGDLVLRKDEATWMVDKVETIRPTDVVIQYRLWLGR
tara:strand:- start:10072 stop:10395 length:324 start_codon:yes stop_codon:yes gene_type:complete